MSLDESVSQSVLYLPSRLLSSLPHTSISPLPPSTLPHFVLPYPSQSLLERTVSPPLPSLPYLPSPTFPPLPSTSSLLISSLLSSSHLHHTKSLPFPPTSLPLSFLYHITPHFLTLHCVPLLPSSSPPPLLPLSLHPTTLHLTARTTLPYLNQHYTVPHYCNLQI